jgi:hypothetical protein
MSFSAISITRSKCHLLFYMKTCSWVDLRTIFLYFHCFHPSLALFPCPSFHLQSLVSLSSLSMVSVITSGPCWQDWCMWCMCRIINTWFCAVVVVVCSVQCSWFCWADIWICIANAECNKSYV